MKILGQDQNQKRLVCAKQTVCNAHRHINVSSISTQISTGGGHDQGLVKQKYLAFQNILVGLMYMSPPLICFRTHLYKSQITHDDVTIFTTRPGDLDQSALIDTRQRQALQ